MRKIEKLNADNHLFIKIDLDSIKANPRAGATQSEMLIGEYFYAKFAFDEKNPAHQSAIAEINDANIISYNHNLIYGDRRIYYYLRVDKETFYGLHIAKPDYLVGLDYKPKNIVVNHPPEPADFFKYDFPDGYVCGRCRETTMVFAPFAENKRQQESHSLYYADEDGAYCKHCRALIEVSFEVLANAKQRKANLNDSKQKA